MEKKWRMSHRIQQTGVISRLCPSILEKEIWPYCLTTCASVLVVIYLLLAFGKYNRRQRVKEVWRLENIQLIRMMHSV